MSKTTSPRLALVGILFYVMFFWQNGFSQSYNLLPNSPAYHTLDRLEIKSGSLYNNLFLDANPIAKNVILDYLNKTDTTRQNNGLTKADGYWIKYLKAEIALPNDSINQPKGISILKNNVYKSTVNLYEYQSVDRNIWVQINPVAYLQYGRGQIPNALDSGRTYSETISRNTRGIELRGALDKRVGFYTFVADNQTLFPYGPASYLAQNKVLVGETYVKPYKSRGADYFTARGYITFSPTKHINFQFGHDRNKIGNGIRSNLLDNLASDYLHLKITTKIWRFQYQNIFAELTDGQRTNLKFFPKKYAAIHYLSIDLAKWLNVGLFESVVFNNPRNTSRGFDFAYLNPIIFYRAVEQSNGSADNAFVGANFSSVIAKRFRLYGQIMLDEFKVGEVFKNNQLWWGNKYALQLGVKYVDVLGLNNLDIQVEYNHVRPYTFQSDTSGKNYQHFGQPLSNPNGANLREFIFTLLYNPTGKFLIKAQISQLSKGYDIAGSQINYGGNILRTYYNYKSEYGNNITQGYTVNRTLIDMQVTYQLFHNVNVDITGQHAPANELMKSNYYYAALGIRYNFILPDHFY